MLTSGKVKSREELISLVDGLRSSGKNIVTCNGTFDILHAGHVAFLEEARKQGDVLIVGVNDDASVKRNKGDSRPINSDVDRARVLAGLGCVDYVTIFSEETPDALLEVLKPEVHVNGSEYGEDCIESATVKKNGGRIHVVTLLDGYSTTSIIGRLQG
ncbi:MAG: adenylyltransferase/cytidyltransferase family protein [Nanoarchaeota archaeon]|nr:adenylyltransferase/cytidyltransferase family protein [Nanoarchaeota archaeon]